VSISSPERFHYPPGDFKPISPPRSVADAIEWTAAAASSSLPVVTRNNDTPSAAGGDDAQRTRHPLAHLRTCLISGILVLLPVIITLAVVKFVFDLVTGGLTPVIARLLSEADPIIHRMVAFLLTLFFIYLIGLTTRHVVGRRLVRAGEAFLLRIPVLKTVYGPTKQTIDMLTNRTRNDFKSVALCQFPERGSYVIGFVTGTVTDADGHVRHTVFLPTTPNPTSGYLLILPPDRIEPVEMSVEDAMRVVMTGGVLGGDLLGRRTASGRAKLPGP